jgi:hypothetical protein
VRANERDGSGEALGAAPASSAVALPPATAKVSARNTSGAPDARPAAGSSDVAPGTAAAPANAPSSPAAVPSPTAGVATPSPADLRLEAACAKRNPHAYQVETAADPCAQLARGKTPQSGAAADPVRPAGIGRFGTGIALGMPVLAGVAIVVAGWAWWWRRRRGNAAIDARADAADPSALRVPA